MSLFDTKAALREQAAKLPMRYEKYDIDELANNYCKAVDENNDENKNIYLSALILRFWYKIDRMYQQISNLGYDRDDVFYRLYECIETACHYRAWQNPEKNTNAQACINQVLSVRGVPAMAYEAKLQKNTRGVTILDETIDEENGTTRGELIADKKAEDAYDTARSSIQDLINESKIVEAIIADHIANNDVFKHERKSVKKKLDDNTVYKYYDVSSEFWPFELVKELNAIDEDYVKYFARTYDIEVEKLAVGFKTLLSANNQKKYRYIEKTISALRDVYAMN